MSLGCICFSSEWLQKLGMPIRYGEKVRFKVREFFICTTKAKHGYMSN